jgi:hypothetical protein
MKRIALVSLLVFLVGVPLVQAGPMPGAIFTTLEDGSRVNANIYRHKEDVYLDGGPGINAPISAAGLPVGDYYFQVTDPSGKKLLSKDPVKCREFTVNADGVIDGVTSLGCAHQTGFDVDHGAVTVQLMPYSNTPNKGGVYKVWVTPVGRFDGNPENVDNPGQFHGFIPSWSKTDNYKVKKGKPVVPLITVRKIHDLNANGIIDFGEPEIGVDEFVNSGGWPVHNTDPLGGGPNDGYTPWTFVAQAGVWNVYEDLLAGWQQTGAYLDGVSLGVTPSVNVNVVGIADEVHEVVFLNVKLGKISACKGYDVGADGVPDGIPVPGFKICLEGTAVNGTPVGPLCGFTNQSGCVVPWEDLLPGSYTIKEYLPDGWYNSTPLEVVIDLLGGDETVVNFLNYCTGLVGMHTKGFWQNQGCSIVTGADLAYLNGLLPLTSGSFRTTGQDNCEGVPCPGITELPFDNVSELGCYIVAPNSKDDSVGMTQQLIAFILNIRHGADFNADLILPGGGTATAQEIIDEAIAAWESGKRGQIKNQLNLLDALNNAGELEFMSGVPCAIDY